MAQNNQTPSNAAPLAVSNKTPLAPRREMLRRVIDSVIVYDPHPLSRPQVDPDLLEMSWFPRVLEVFRYNAFCLEYALGNDGWLRGWALSAVRVLLFIILPLGTLWLIVSLFVPIFGGIAALSASLASSLYNVAIAMIWCMVIVVLVPLTVGLAGVIWKRREPLMRPWTDQPAQQTKRVHATVRESLDDP